MDPKTSTRAEPLFFLAIKHLAILHYTVGRKSSIGFQRSDILPAGTPKRRLSECTLDKSSFWGCQIL